MRAHLVQFDIAWEDKPANHRRVDGLVDATGVEPGDLILLPEMFDTGFSMRVERTGRDADASEAYLRGLAERTGATVVGGVTIPGPGGRARNRALVHDAQGRLACAYDKVHPFSFGREPERFDGGDAPAVFEWGGLVVCPVVCYDLRFPELFRAGLDLGAEAFAVIANWPRDRRAHWRALAVARAIENQAFVLGLNRCGDDPHLAYAGGSLVVGPMGEIDAEAGEGQEVLAATIEPDRVRSWRDRFPAWRDRRLGKTARSLGSDREGAESENRGAVHG